MKESVPAYLKKVSGGIIISIHVQPRAKKNEVVGLHGDRLKVRLTAPPVDSKANEALCNFFSKLLNVPRSSVHLISGEKSREKNLRIDGISEEQVAQLIKT